MSPDNDGARSLALARSALTRANEAHSKAEQALEGYRSVYDALGALTTELARLGGGIGGLSERLSGLERLVKEGFRQLGTGVVQAKRAAQKSGHELAALAAEVEDSKVTQLKGELEEARSKYLSLRARDKAVRGWSVKFIVGVAIIVVGAWLTIKFGLHK